MFQRKLIAVLGASVLLVVAAGTGHASVARVQAMDLSTPLFSQFTDDYVNIYSYPTSVVRQNNLVLAELGENSGGSVPASTDNRSLTLIKNFPKFGAIAFDMRQSGQTNFPSNINNQLLDLIWGKAFTKMDLALRFDISNSSIEHSDTSPLSYEAHGAGFAPSDPYPFGGVFFPGAMTFPGIEMNTWGITPAVAFHMQNDNRIEGAITFREYSLDRKINATDAESWQDAGNLSIGVSIRGVLNHGDRETWYPAFWYIDDDLGYSVDNLGGVAGLDRSVDESYKSWGVGISNNMKVNDNNLLLVGIAFSEYKQEYTRTDTNAGGLATDRKTFTSKANLLPSFFASLETQATSWLTVRMGANKDWSSSEETSTDFATPTGSSTENEDLAGFNFTLGTGIKWNNLDIDMTLNDVFPLTGGWILSGDEATPFTHVSATYHF